MKSQMVDFSKRASSLDDVFTLIQESVLGKEVIKRFSALRQQKSIQFQSLPVELKQKLRWIAPAGTPFGAAFVTDGREAQIFYDPEAELGVLVPFLFHEMVHALDQTLWVAAQGTLSAEERSRTICFSEVRAFAAQHQLQDRLKKIYPELREFYKRHYPHVSFLNRELNREEIFDLYRF
ncbi:MAG: hypothetical protein ACO3A2_10990 [Bdellovibrionia bacterium]